jgi:hypothetical protein
MGPESSQHPTSPLSLDGLRNLATLVRHLRERAEARGEEHADDAVVEQRRIGHEQPPNVPGPNDQSPFTGGSADLGELPASRSPSADRGDRSDRTAPASGATGRGPRAGAEVRQQ